MQINTHNLPPDLAGELLRYYLFKENTFQPEKYLTIYPIEEVISNPVKKDLLLKYSEYLPDDWENYQNGYGIQYYIVRIGNNKIEIVIWHDGDTTLIINDFGRILINNDAKRDHGWWEIEIP